MCVSRRVGLGTVRIRRDGNCLFSCVQTFLGLSNEDAECQGEHSAGPPDFHTPALQVEDVGTTGLTTDVLREALAACIQQAISKGESHVVAQIDDTLAQAHVRIRDTRERHGRDSVEAGLSAGGNALEMQPSFNAPDSEALPTSKPWRERCTHVRGTAKLPAQALHSSLSDASGSSLKREAEELISRGGCLQSPEGRALYVKLVSRDGAFCERLELSVLAEMLGNEVNACTQWLVDRMETGG